MNHIKNIHNIIAILTAVAIAFAAASCSADNPADRSERKGTYYYHSGASDIDSSSVFIGDDGTFTFCFSMLSSYMGHGDYTVNGDVVTLHTDDGEYHYTFLMKDGNLVFDAEHSSEELWMGDFADGSVFVSRLGSE